MGERRGRGKQRNMNRGLMGTDNGGIDCGSRGYGVGESNGEKGGTTVTEQQYIFKKGDSVLQSFNL